MNRVMWLTVPAMLSISLLALAGNDAGKVNKEYQATQKYYQSILQGNDASSSELNLFMNLLPKGGDLHHHYSGALYAETYLEWMGKQGYCVYQKDVDGHRRFTIETSHVDAAVSSGACVRTEDVMRDNGLYREVLKHWSDKDFDNHSHESAPPDKQFFDTFGYFGPASTYDARVGLQILKERAKAQNLQYIESMFKHAPGTHHPQLEQAINALGANASEREIEQAMSAFTAFLDQDSATQKAISDFREEMKRDAAGIDDAGFTLRFQTYVVRVVPPGQVFSALYSAFAAANDNPLLVGVNIVAPENANVSMRDYDLHMKMFSYLKKRFPHTRLDLHAGELTLGMVPPEGLRDHIRKAIDIAGAERIGHGVDVTYEDHPDELLALMRSRNIPVEINLSSNAFILGVKGREHPLHTYIRHHVPFVIATDDEGVSRSSMTHEYVLYATEFKPNYATLKQTVYNSIRYSFLSDADKKEELKRLDQRFAEFESRISKLAAH